MALKKSKVAEAENEQKEAEQVEKRGVAKPPVLFSKTQNLIKSIEKRLNATLITATMQVLCMKF